MSGPTNVHIQSGDFSCIESFASEADAAHWERMVLETLARPEAIWFDIRTYAVGLAETVRTHGGDLTREKWLSGEASSDQWALGLPVNAEAVDLPAAAVKAKRRLGRDG